MEHADAVTSAHAVVYWLDYGYPAADSGEPRWSSSAPAAGSIQTQVRWWRCLRARGIRWQPCQSTAANPRLFFFFQAVHWLLRQPRQAAPAHVSATFTASSGALSIKLVQ